MSQYRDRGEIASARWWHFLAEQQNVMYTPEMPWFNKKKVGNNTPPRDDITKAKFADVLQNHLKGASLANLDLDETPNLYLCMGFASQGYEDWASIESALSSWCDANDKRHRAEGTGWILLTNGDGDYGKASIETIAQFVRKRGIPVVFVQSDFAYCEPWSEYWPTYASAGFFGEGIYHDLYKVDKAGVRTQNKREVWGGYAKDSNGLRDGRISYPDAAVLYETFGSVQLNRHMGGIFVAGGGDIAVEQVELYGVVRREGDLLVPACAANGTPSKLNSLPASQVPKWQEVVVNNDEGRSQATSGGRRPSNEDERWLFSIVERPLPPDEHPSDTMQVTQGSAPTEAAAHEAAEVYIGRYIAWMQSHKDEDAFTQSTHSEGTKDIAKKQPGESYREFYRRLKAAKAALSANPAADYVDLERMFMITIINGELASAASQVPKRQEAVVNNDEGRSQATSGGRRPSNEDERWLFSIVERPLPPDEDPFDTRQVTQGSAPTEAAAHEAAEVFMGKYIAWMQSHKDEDAFTQSTHSEGTKYIAEKQPGESYREFYRRLKAAKAALSAHPELDYDLERMFMITITKPKTKTKTKKTKKNKTKT